MPVESGFLTEDVTPAARIRGDAIRISNSSVRPVGLASRAISDTTNSNNLPGATTAPSMTAPEEAEESDSEGLDPDSDPGAFAGGERVDRLKS
jgi:hypothetical protein